MRYSRGSLAITLSRDIPLLLQVRNSRFITHDQLFRLMELGRYEHSRSSFNWRLKRLLDSGYLAVCPPDFGTGGPVYQSTRTGLLQLEDHGKFATVLNSWTQHLPHPSHVHHALELNAIQIALGASGVLAGWQSDVETASTNTVSRSPLGKDYDAVVNVWNGQKLARFALEYERTLKSARKYLKIRQTLESENRVGCVLYLTSGVEIVLHLANELSGIPKRLAFATSPAFRERLLDTPVMVHPNQPEVAFRALLKGVF